MNTMTVEEFQAQCKAQGVPWEHLAFRCVMCGTIQSIHSLLTAGAGKSYDDVEKYLGFSCVGRFTGAGSFVKGTPPGKGCNWTLGGLFTIHKLEVVDSKGKKHPHFELATPEEAKELMDSFSAAPTT